MQIPGLWKRVDDGEPATSYNIAAMATGFAVMAALLWIGTSFRGSDIPYGPLMMVVAGAVAGICILSPGISASAILISLGLFAAAIQGLSSLDLSAILPMIVGLALGLLLFSKVVDHFVTNNRRSTYFAIIGLTAGSVVTVAANGIMALEGDGQLLECIAAAAAGLVLGWCMYSLSMRYVVPNRCGIATVRGPGSPRWR